MKPRPGSSIPKRGEGRSTKCLSLLTASPAQPQPCIDLPLDFDPGLHPIIATHFYGLALRDGREVFWNFARQGVELPAEKGVILIRGGRP
jgi:hypothetical protein